MADLIAPGFNPGIEKKRLVCVLAAKTVNYSTSISAKTPSRLVQRFVSEQTILIAQANSDKSGSKTDWSKRWEGRD